MGWLRHPKTQNERRQWAAAEDLVKEYRCLRIRRSRSIAGLPHAWDDLMVHGSRSWKKTRSSQYRSRTERTGRAIAAAGPSEYVIRDRSMRARWSLGEVRCSGFCMIRFHGPVLQYRRRRSFRRVHPLKA